MAIAAVKIKIMPVSPEADLEVIKDTAKSMIESADGKNPTFEEEPIAFGLKAIIALFAWPEEKELEELEGKLKNIEDVNSVQVIDIRRAFGS
ncbi:MAG: elongation factor 1-beta [Candidatus Nanoarchaeia archaeon]|nr:elongation factor 1-beta [Candidatus Nanoarchaeia archaeon]MDD5358489.1 elongation factor 1-beta [Candidatus Nanoarchaeia archaeon]MDD5589003.1 elongation factor 1-beta [Candidatus Nanoarchaeia archaeon]